MWKYASLERFIQDVRYGARLFRRSPGFSVVAVLTLALGIGANTAIFSVVNAVLLKPLPCPHPDRLVHIWEGKVGEGASKNVVEPFNFLDWRERNRSFEKMVAIDGGVTLNVTGIGEPEALPGMMVTTEFFDILGVPPLIGRGFIPEEGSPGQYLRWIHSRGPRRGLAVSLSIAYSKYTRGASRARPKSLWR